MTEATKLARAQQKFALARISLLKLVEHTCPGDHRVVPHRDGLPPWCRACRRDRYGRTVEALRTASALHKERSQRRVRAM
jgi:hypothetical protein